MHKPPPSSDVRFLSPSVSQPDADRYAGLSYGAPPAQGRPSQGPQPVGGPPPPLTPLDPARGIQVRFTGNAGDYLYIWLVNLILSVLTIGIWSAWAKVRRLRYFYGHTHILDGSLDYVARPVTLLIGRLIVFGVLIAYYAASLFNPMVAWLISLVILGLLPWAINRSITFNARMTVWRNVRFNFHPSFWGAVWSYLVFPTLTTFTVWLLSPFSSRSRTRFYTNRHRLGQARFRSEPPIGRYYTALAGAFSVFWAVFLLTLTIIGTLAYLIVSNGDVFYGESLSQILSQLWEEASQQGDPQAIAILATLFVYGVLFILLPALYASQTCYRTIVRAAVIDYLELEGGHRFCSTLSGLRYTWIVLSNTVVIVFTLGFGAPWAAVRAWKYQCSCLYIFPNGSVDDFVSANESPGGAFGSEFTDIEAFEIGI